MAKTPKLGRSRKARTSNKQTTPAPLTIDTISDDQLNANVGTKRGRELVESSIRTYGAGRSVVADKNGRLIGGHKTLAGAKAAGIKKIREVQTSGDELVVVRRMDLDITVDARARELAVADNRAGEVGLEWSPENLRAIQTAGADLGRAGFTAVELETLFGAPVSTDTGEAVEIARPSEVVWVLIAVPVRHWTEIAQALEPIQARADITVQTTRPRADP